MRSNASLIHLSSRERQVMCSTQHDALRSIEQIAELAKVRVHQAAYTLRNLKQRGILGSLRPAFNAYALGYSDYAFYFSLESSQQRQRSLLLNQIKRSPAVSWCAQVGGPYQYAVSILAKHSSEVQSYLDQLGKAIEGNVSGDLAIRTRVLSYGRKYLSTLAKKGSLLWFGGEPGSAALDKTDYGLLEVLAHKSYDSWREAARLAGLSASLVLRRIQAYEQMGLINGYYYEFDPTRLGIQVFNLLLCSRSLTLRLREPLEKFARQHPRIVHFVECLGRWNFELVVECERADEAANVACEVRDCFSGEIASLEIIPVFGYLKASLFPFGSPPNHA
jgi:DNA-binding Lrp family transcriptional regulator